jgi:hypothetical protein
MFLVLADPDPPSPSTSKKSKKNLVFSFERNFFFVGILSATEEKAESGSRAGSVSQVSGTDPLIRIRNKMSRIHNTGRIILYLISCFSKFVSIILEILQIN